MTLLNPHQDWGLAFACISYNHIWRIFFSGDVGSSSTSEPHRSSQRSWPVFCAKLDKLAMGAKKKGADCGAIANLFQLHCGGWNACPQILSINYFKGQPFLKSQLFRCSVCTEVILSLVFDPSKLRLQVGKEGKYLWQGHLEIWVRSDKLHEL